jgi:hypothetical protein
MKYLVTRAIKSGIPFEVAIFVNRWHAERYAEQESGLSGWTYMVEEVREERCLLSSFSNGAEFRTPAFQIL